MLRRVLEVDAAEVLASVALHDTDYPQFTLVIISDDRDPPTWSIAVVSQSSRVVVPPDDRGHGLAYSAGAVRACRLDDSSHSRKLCDKLQLH